MNNSLDKKQGIYIELDALLDTRLSTLYSLGEKVMLDVLDKNYFSRRSDKFHNISKEIFDKAYKQRNKKTLQNAIVTKTIGYIKELVTTMNRQAMETPLHTGPKIIVNTYPYILTEEELKIIIAGIAASTSGTCDIEAIHKSPEEITPRYCNNNFAIMFIYDYAPWLEAQTERFKTNRCADITVVVPGIYFVREPTNEELFQAINNGMHPLKAIEYISSVFIGLKLHDIDLFCANIPSK